MNILSAWVSFGVAFERDGTSWAHRLVGRHFRS